MKHLLITFSLLFSFQVIGQNMNNELEKLSPFIQALNNFSKTIPQEKVYLHFDNTSYYQNDDVWFKCYVTSSQHQLSDLSKTLYVELLNPGGELVDKRILKIENGQCHGDFSLNHLPFYSGFYEIRAYTKYMLNFGDDVIFSRLLPVFDKPKTAGNFEEKNMLRYSKWGIREYPIKRKYPEKGKTVNLRFFPESGNLVQGVESQIAFEATDENGNPIDVAGIVMDASKQKLSTLTTLHEGRGVFSYTPVAGRRKDIAEVEYSGKKYQFELPASLPQGVVMNVDNATYPDSIAITLKKNSSTSTGILGIAVLNGGSMQNAYSAYFEEDEDEIYFLIDKTQLPSGVTQIVLFNAKGEIICDRLIFTGMDKLLNSEFLDLKATVAKPVYEPYELIDMEVSVTGKQANPVSATFSMSVRDGDNEVENKHNILTELLLTSEIKGFVRNPAFYFEGIAGQARNDRQSLLDLLLMVQGWRRYSWEQMTASAKTGQTPAQQLKYLPEQGIETNGNVVSFVRQIPKPNVDVSMLLTNNKWGEYEDRKSFLKTFATDNQGRFTFVSDLPGKWNMILSVTEKGKKKDHLIFLERDFSPEPKSYAFTDLQVNITRKNNRNLINEKMTDLTEDDSDSFLIAYRDSLAKQNKNEKVLQLKEVVIKGKKNTKEQDIFHNRSTSIVYYDIPSEMDNIFDRGKYIGDDIHELMQNINNQFILRTTSVTDDHVVSNEYLEYKHKKPLFIINYEIADFSRDYGFEYFKYRGIRLDAIKSIFINESQEAICQYCFYPNPEMTCNDIAKIYSCVVFIETHTTNLVPAKAGKGVRKTWLEGYSPVKQFYSPNYSIEPIELDYRRTLYWNPMVTTGEDGKVNLQFYNNSKSTSFSISAETVTAEGMIGVNNLINE